VAAGRPLEVEPFGRGDGDVHVSVFIRGVLKTETNHGGTA
jgi:hypothetical protein